MRAGRIVALALLAIGVFAIMSMTNGAGAVRMT